ncbi:recombinase family protein [Aquisediminimonas sediminicola]|uniref:recombinase family protein n=1 Tax=Alteraquisediminimonas sediminicola TaxID=2676787 RepID=UPI001C8E26F7|nr:recombinase family protein [Aquisediminimonas sediminicola]
MLPDYYDDGGYSGGNMDRPGLKKLLADVSAGKVDVIVVYKVDRLTRALSDFAKIVDILDAEGASFVSITQTFNTTTSMGRLTLNVLLSFAQFEREVISERVRDKIAASKRKGMWMGGRVPLGYSAKDRKLIVHESEAEIVRYIMQRYVGLGSVKALKLALDRENMRTKVQTWSNGKSSGGNRYGVGQLYHILSNRIYRGEIVHKGEVYPGEHQAIVREDLWAAVQAKLSCNKVERRNQVCAEQPSILAGMISDIYGRPMTPSHASKGPIRYRYYISMTEVGRAAGSSRAVRLSAGELEPVVIAGFKALLDDRAALVLNLQVSDGVSSIVHAIDQLRAEIDVMPPSALRGVLFDLGLKIEAGRDEVAADVDTVMFARKIGVVIAANTQIPSRIPLPIANVIKRRGHELRMVVSGDSDGPSKRDGRLVAFILKAQQAKRKLMELNADEIQCADEYSLKHLARMARIAYLAPDIIAAILDGTQPQTLNARGLLRAAEVPLSWNDQRRMLGFG